MYESDITIDANYKGKDLESMKTSAAPLITLAVEDRVLAHTWQILFIRDIIWKNLGTME